MALADGAIKGQNDNLISDTVNVDIQYLLIPSPDPILRLN